MQGGETSSLSAIGMSGLEKFTLRVTRMGKSTVDEGTWPLNKARVRLRLKSYRLVERQKDSAFTCKADY
jgi:hypothetical protein